ncbi:glutaredoxin [Candidatus Woesearchaeota archaeon]|nr:glutaredoxin [Candidatus Woesearchaeota archaeon]
MAKVKIYGKKICSYCQDAKRWFSDEGIAFEYEDISDEKLSELQKETGIDTVPQIFINGAFIGGWVKTMELIENGELMKLLAVDD